MADNEWADWAYVKRNKNDAVDAAACCEAVRRPTVRTVPVKTPEQQAQLMQHRVRDLLVRQRTQTINALRSHLAELGIIAAQGYEGLKTLLSIITGGSDARLPENARASCLRLVKTTDAKRSSRSIGKTRQVPREERARRPDWDPIRGSHHGQRPMRLHQ